MNPIVKQPDYVHAHIMIWRLCMAILVAFAILLLISLDAETLVASDSTSPQERLQQLERFLQAHPGAFDWNVHNELRHL
jgi:hypothetical protein